ncbi:unnamed protein product [Tilletia controversa]|uniref:Small ribosomal subunit protein mS41 n=3 Tax=Tilletia TaxID=13289 RepID=A0A8X7MU41_9BASI|nr:hypothetical protein CF336_g3880 [Tilletia laevis]KAE8196203.1 hypothetical protein CF328_g4205 [Tilletia controversa]KAE8261476.1 hypothetical protein A4X03_0g3222 [Tilletia caries]KAE8201756.1 hypothetical protein CF335_g3673 [Tilletia laevis]KAE8249014.1 hypothetical protein A4X06_0g3426 [Tilletia controversa]
MRTSILAHSLARSFATSAAHPARASALPLLTIPTPRSTVHDPKTFLQSISRGPRRQLDENAAALGALTDTWEGMWSKVLGPSPSSSAPRARGAAATTSTTTSPRAGKQINKDLKSGGVPVKDRRYILWALEKYRQGLDPAQFSIGVKPKKKIRGWGPRVQNGIRVRGRKRPGEK